MTGFKRHNGFTLIETLVSAAIFGTIMIIVGSVFVSSLSLQARAFNIQQVEENVSYVFELMTKEIRVSQIQMPFGGGPISTCPTTPATALTVLNQFGQTVTYSLAGTNLTRRVNGFSTVLNSNTVQFLSFGICVSGAEIGDGQQPRVTIFSTVKSVKTKQAAAVKTQTTISVRILSD